MKKIFLLLLFISSFLFAQDEIKRHPLWIDLGSGVATPKAQYNIYPFGNQLGNLGATANRWNFIFSDTTITNHLTSSTLSGGVISGTSLALNGATIGTNALAVTGTAYATSFTTGSNLQTLTIVYDGDSMTKDTSGTVAHYYDYYITPPTFNGNTFTTYNIGTPGRRLSVMADNAYYAPNTYYSNLSARSILVVWIGVNDLRDGETPATVYSLLEGYCAKKQREGWKIIVLTLPSNSTKDAERITYNSYIRGNWSRFADALADLETDADIGALGAYSNATYFRDGLHMTDAGYVKVAAIVQSSMANINTNYPNRIINGKLVVGENARTTDAILEVQGDIADDWAIRGYNTSATGNGIIARLSAEDGAKIGLGLYTASSYKFRVLTDGTGILLGNLTLGSIAGIGVYNLYADKVLPSNGTAASPSYSFTSDPNSGMYSVGADQLGLSVNGSNMVTVTTTGAGIGTTAPTGNLEILHGAGKVPAITGVTPTGGLIIRSTESTALTMGTGEASIGYAGWLQMRHGTIADVAYPLLLNPIAGNVGIATTSPLATFHDNGTAMFGAGTGASLTDSSLVINYTTGSPVLNWYGTDGDTWNLGINTSDHAVFSGATLYSFDNGMTFADPGTSANSYAINLIADNATTTQTGAIQVMYGADPYLRISAPNDAGVATAILDLKDQRVVIGAGTDGVDYDIFGNGFSSQGTITFMEDEDRWDFDNDIKVGASLWGSAQMSGTDAFTTTATADTVTVTGATVNDIYILTYITAVTAAEAPLSVTATATGFIATRPAGTTSAASYAWMRQRK